MPSVAYFRGARSQVRERLATMALKREEKHQAHCGSLEEGNALADQIGKQLALAELNQRNKARVNMVDNHMAGDCSSEGGRCTDPCPAPRDPR